MTNSSSQTRVPQTVPEPSGNAVSAAMCNNALVQVHEKVTFK